MPFYENNLLIPMSHVFQAVIEQPHFPAFREYEVLHLPLRQNKNISFLVDTILNQFGQCYINLCGYKGKFLTLLARDNPTQMGNPFKRYLKLTMFCFSPFFPFFLLFSLFLSRKNAPLPQCSIQKKSTLTLVLQNMSCMHNLDILMYI